MSQARAVEGRRSSAQGVNARYAAALVATLSLSATLAFQVAPQIDPTIGNRRLHVAIEISAGMILVFVAAVVLAHYRRGPSRQSLFTLSAVLVMALDALFSGVLTVFVDSLSDSGYATWTTAMFGIFGAFALAAAGVLPERELTDPPRAEKLAIGGAVAVMAIVAIGCAIFQDALPGAFASPPTTSEQLRLLSEHLESLTVAESLTALAYGVAAVGFTRQAEQRDDDFLQWLGISSVIATGAYVNYALFPSRLTELLYSGDLFLLAAFATLCVGAVREISNEEQQRVRGAVLEERRRVARELHDGVAQELAFVVSQGQWYMQRPDGDRPIGEIIESVQRALDESRGAIASLNRPMDEPLDKAIEHAASDVGERLGARVHLDLADGIDAPDELREALLRIVRESVSNAVRHGHARNVRLELRNSDGLHLRVVDDGEGFDVAAPPPKQSFGLAGMRDRTEALGGAFDIISVPGAGTTIEVTLP